MNTWKRAVYRGCVGAIRLYERCLLDVRVDGREHIPPGPAICVPNHITALDPLYVLPLFPEPVHCVLGPQYKYKPAAWLWDTFEQINAMPARRAQVVDRAVAYLRRGDRVVVFPEGDLQDQPHLGPFFPGAARMYLQYPVPIIPIALAAPPGRLREYPFVTRVDGRVYRCVVLLRGRLSIRIGEPMLPDIPDAGSKGSADRIMSMVRERIEGLLTGIR